MSEQDPLGTYSLWAKQASILEEKEPNGFTAQQKSDGVDKKENMDEKRRAKPVREDSGFGINTRKEVKHVPKRTRIVPSSEFEDTIQVCDSLSFRDKKMVSSVHDGTLSIEKNSLHDFKTKLSTTKRRHGLRFKPRFSSYFLSSQSTVATKLHCTSCHR